MQKILLALVLCTALTSGMAQNPNSKPITLVVPFPPGGSTDQIARALAPKASTILDQPVLVDNKSGASGTIGALQVKRAPNDGQMLLVTSLGPLVLTPHLMKPAPYDALNDFDPITVLAQSPNLLVVPQNSPFNKISELIAAAKRNQAASLGQRQVTVQAII